MDDKTLNENDDLLLRLMDRYKPHLKPYAFRLQTWEQVLENYNAQTGSKYRQIRTLKKKFEKLRDQYEDNESKLEIGNIELLRKLIQESKQQNMTKHNATTKSHPQLRKMHTTNEEDLTAGAIRNFKIRRENADIDENNQRTQSSTNHLSSSELKSCGLGQPPPLDSITIGFPHGNSQSHNDLDGQTNSSPSQISVGSNPFDPSINLGQTRNAFSADKTKLMPSANGSPIDEQLNAQINSRIITNLISHITTQQNIKKSTGSNRSSPLSLPHHSSNLSIENLYSELQHIRRSQEEFQNEIIYRLDIISAGLAENINLLGKQGQGRYGVTTKLPEDRSQGASDDDEHLKELA